MNGRVAWKRPTRFIFGDPAALDRGFQRVAEHPELAPDEPLWRKDFATARQRMFDLFERFDSALRQSAFLSPLGNAVAIRGLAPMAVQFHMLDYLGQIDDQQRRQVIDQLAALAEMVARRDFYPYDYAMNPPEFPYGEHSFYRGMLNQNFPYRWLRACRFGRLRAVGSSARRTLAAVCRSTVRIADGRLRMARRCMGGKPHLCQPCEDHAAAICIRHAARAGKARSDAEREFPQNLLLLCRSSHTPKTL